MKPRGNLARLEGRKSPTHSLDRHRLLHRAALGQAGFARRSGQIAGAQKVYCVAQLPYPLRAARKRDTGLGRAQREPVPQQGVGEVNSAQHKMQMAQRRLRQKRNIFKGFSTRGGDLGGYAGYRILIVDVIRSGKCHVQSLHCRGAFRHILTL